MEATSNPEAISDPEAQARLESQPELVARLVDAIDHPERAVPVPVRGH